MSVYPSWRYHESGEKRLIESPIEEEAGWLPNPGMFLPVDDPRHVPPPQEPKTEQPAPADVPEPKPVGQSRRKK